MDTDKIIDGAVRSVIGRVVAALTPVIAAALGAGALWLQNAVGIDLQEHVAVATGFVASIVLGTVAMGWKWLHGRQGYEKFGQALAEIREHARRYAEEEDRLRITGVAKSWHDSDDVPTSE